MSTTVTYKGATLTTAENQTRTLKTAGTYLEDDITVTDVTSGGSAPVLQSKTKSYTPTETAQSETVTADSGYDGLSDVAVSVGAISSTYVGSGVSRRTSSDLTASGATVTAPAGYYESAATKSVASGSATAPATISGTAATVSTGNNTLTLTKSVSVIPSVTAGYVSSGTAGNSSVSLTANVTTKGAATYTPSTSQQTIASGTYLTGTQTIAAIPSQYIVPSGNKEITANGTNIDVAQYSTVTVNVPSGGGSTKNVQAYRGYATVTATSYTATAVTVTVAKAGTYNVSWMGWRNTNSGTSGSQLYRNNTAVGSANTSFVGTYGHSVSLTNQTFNQGDVLVVRARARSTSYQMVVGNLIIEEV